MTEIHLPMPPSANNLFFNVAGVGRVPTAKYRMWRADASEALHLQKPRPVLGRCEIWIDLDDKRKGDADNYAKAVLDALVKHGTLGGDSKKHVKRVSVGWANVDGCRVAIEEAT